MRSILVIIVLFFCGELTAQHHDLKVRAELVWVESSTDEHKIMYSQLAGDKWSKPLMIYISENYITTPTMSTDLDNNKSLIWSEQRDNNIILMSTRKVPSNTKWAQAKELNDFKAENLSPSIVTDSLNRSWVFWSSNFEGLDDIYYSRQESSQWSSPRRVHANNDVPDIQPIASLDEELNVVVRWKTYNRSTAQYLTVQQLFPLDTSIENRYKKLKDNSLEESISGVAVPNFLPKDSAIILHFPNNKIEQSVRLDLEK